MHPSVAAFARTLLAGTYVTYDGDPLRDLTLTAFLDKFVQRKPKVWYRDEGLGSHDYIEAMHCFADDCRCSHHCGKSVQRKHKVCTVLQLTAAAIINVTKPRMPQPFINVLC